MLMAILFPAIAGVAFANSSKQQLARRQVEFEPVRICFPFNK